MHCYQYIRYNTWCRCVVKDDEWIQQLTCVLIVWYSRDVLSFEAVDTGRSQEYCNWCWICPPLISRKIFCFVCRVTATLTLDLSPSKSSGLLPTSWFSDKISFMEICSAEVKLWPRKVSRWSEGQRLESIGLCLASWSCHPSSLVIDIWCINQVSLYGNEDNCLLKNNPTEGYICTHFSFLILWVGHSWGVRACEVEVDVASGSEVVQGWTDRQPGRQDLKQTGSCLA